MKQDKIDYLEFLKDYAIGSKDRGVSLVSNRIMSTEGYMLSDKTHSS